MSRYELESWIRLKEMLREIERQIFNYDEIHKGTIREIFTDINALIMIIEDFNKDKKHFKKYLKEQERKV